jgi:sulfatase maturation enzyme AslB (radical SAM superfamily)
LHTDPVTIDIHLDNDCNAACVTCDQNNSNLWAKENCKSQNVVYIKPQNNIDLAINKIVKTVNLDQVSYIKFFGGEPLFTDTHLKFLEHVPFPENITIHYTTNGSIYPNAQTLEVWKKFKLIIFAVSIDGIDEQFNYIRWPLPWNKVSNNLTRLRDNGSHNLMFRAEFTVNFLNAYYFDLVENWVKDNFSTNRFGDVTELNIHRCFGGIWDLEVMPDSIKNAVLSKYPTDHQIHIMVKNISTRSSIIPWSNFVSKWDSLRTNDWRTAFPELVQYMPTLLNIT